MNDMQRPGLRWLLACLLFGALVSAVLFTSGVIDASADAHPARVTAPMETGLLDVLHRPPLLVERGATITLRYDAVCQANAFGRPCALAGTVFARQAGEPAFSRIALSAEESESTLSATLPASFTAGSGFSYYAVLSDGAGGQMTVPAAGARAPQRAWVVPAVTSVDLAQHVFGNTRKPDGVALRGSWGSGNGDLGLLAGRGQSAIGPSAFDVAPDGSVVVLDQINKRLAIYPSGGGVRYVAIPFTGGEGDVAVGREGTMYVLDRTGSASPVVRSFSSTGASAGAIAVGALGADMLRAGPGGAFVHGYPGDMWRPIGRPGTFLEPTAQANAARGGRSVGGGVEVVVSATEQGALFALVRADSVLRAWRVTSATPFGEVQLAEPLGDGLVAVIRVWSEHEAEFIALVLKPAGLASTFSLDAVEWAESAALGRFRLSGRSLYQLRSAPTGVEVSTIDVGGVR